jgi:uncharacterized protein (TIGR02594 family)
MLSRLAGIALSQYGIKEVPGVKNNPEIMKYFKCIGQDWVQGDETAWCSAFINWCAKKKGFEYSGKLNARSWLNMGLHVESINAADIVVLWRESPQSWKGHVGVPIREEGNNIWVLGGNQSNMVCISAYPKERILKYIKLWK